MAMLKTTLGLILMVVFLIMTFAADEPMHGQFFASLAVLSAGFAYKRILTQNTSIYDKH